MSGLLAVRPLAIPEVKEIIPKSFGDGRGTFREVYNRKRFIEETGLAVEFVQSNQSTSTENATLRGLHFQAPPHAQAKLVWAVTGSVLDVAVDLRFGSPTFGRWVSLLLSAERGNQIFVPAGFAHGFVTRASGASVQYMVDNHYAPAAEFGIRWDDPALAIDWQLSGAVPVLAARDAEFPALADVETPFAFERDAA